MTLQEFHKPQVCARSRFRELVCMGAVLVIAAASIVIASAVPNAVSAGQAVSFKDDVFPVIELRCLSCHQPGGGGYEKSGFDLRTYEGLMKGTKHGVVVVPGSAFTSNLIAVIDRRTDKKLWMPHNKRRLSKCERLSIRAWVNQGAKDN